MPEQPGEKRSEGKGRRSDLPEGYLLSVPHDPDCYAAAPRFILHDGYEWSRKRNGHRGGSTMWHRFTCNCMACDAVLLVRWDVLGAAVNPADLSGNRP